MIIPTETRIRVYTYLFNEGVVVCPKDYRSPMSRHNKFIKGCSNLEVAYLMKGLEARGLVKEQFSWRWFYFFLKDEGIEWLRNKLHIDNVEVLPHTHQKPSHKPDEPERPAYEYTKKDDIEGSSRPRFHSEGFRGRGRGRGGFRGGRGRFEHERSEEAPAATA